MRYAILSDIHSNLEALSAVLDVAQREQVEQILCLGDLVGYGVDPAQCLARLQGCRARSVCGNHDWACAGKFDVQWFNDSAKQAVLWTREHLSVTDLDFLRGLPLVIREGPLTLVHGTLTHPERFEYLVDLAQAVDTITCCTTPFCFVGHTHVPFLLEYDRLKKHAVRVLSESKDLQDVQLSNASEAIRYVINPGSVGQPRDGDPRASFALLDTQAGSVGIRRVAYDIPSTQAKIRATELPEFLAQRLAIGR